MNISDEQIAAAVRPLYTNDKSARMGLGDDIRTARAVLALASQSWSISDEQIKAIHDQQCCLPDLVGSKDQWPEILRFARAVERAAINAVASAARIEALEDAAKACDLQAAEPECPERASYCADAIRRIAAQVAAGTVPGIAAAMGTDAEGKQIMNISDARELASGQDYWRARALRAEEALAIPMNISDEQIRNAISNAIGDEWEQRDLQSVNAYDLRNIAEAVLALASKPAPVAADRSEARRIAGVLRALAAWLSGSARGTHADLKRGPAANDCLTAAGLIDAAMGTDAPVADRSVEADKFGVLKASSEAVKGWLKDAERYRWLRDQADPDNEEPYCAIHKTNDWGKWFDEWTTGEALDERVDAAMGTDTAVGSAK